MFHALHNFFALAANMPRKIFFFERTSDDYQCYMFKLFSVAGVKQEKLSRNGTLEVGQPDKNSLLWLFNLHK